MDIKEVFEKLIFRAKHELAYVNINKDTIWLSDCGFSIKNGELAVRLKTNERVTDEDIIIKYKVPKRKFLRSCYYIVTFLKTLKNIEKEKELEREYNIENKNRQERIANELVLAKLLDLK